LIFLGSHGKVTSLAAQMPSFFPQTKIKPLFFPSNLRSQVLPQRSHWKETTAKSKRTTCGQTAEKMLRMRVPRIFKASPDSAIPSMKSEVPKSKRETADPKHGSHAKEESGGILQAFRQYVQF